MPIQQRAEETRTRILSAAQACFSRSGFAAASVADGSLRVENPTVAANALLGMAVGLILQGLIDPSEADWANIMQEAVRMMLQGMGR